MTDESRPPGSHRDAVHRDTAHRDAPQQDSQDEELLAALDDVSDLPGPAAFQAVAVDVIRLHADLLARLAQ
jgi:hypothetical protein